jgi:hypothetical protein
MREHSENYRLMATELRNRIYELALETHTALTYGTNVMQGRGPAAKCWAERIWKTFGLTQTCKQIHTEYRPLWLRNLFIRASFNNIRRFADTFLSSTRELQHSPERVQIEWDRGMDDSDGDKQDLTSLTRLHTFGSMTDLKFVPDKLASGILPGEDFCWYCIDEMRARDAGDEDWYSPLDECICAPGGEDMDLKDWEAYQYGLISRSTVVHRVVCNNNAKWIEDIREERMTVQCIFGKTSSPITFRFLCKDRFCEATKHGDASTHAEDAWDLLQAWGIFDLPSQDEMKFVVAFEAEKKIKKGVHELTSVEVREVRVKMGG